MKKSICLSLLVLLMTESLFSASEQETATKQTVVAGRIIGYNMSSEINIRSFFLSDISVGINKKADINGNFVFKFSLPAEIEIYLYYDKIGTHLLLGPGDSLFIIIDKSKVPAFQFFGTKGQFHTDYYSLIRSINSTRKYEDPMMHWRNDTPEQYYEYRLEKYKIETDTLRNLIHKGNYSSTLFDFFKSRYKVNLGYELLQFLSMQQTLKQIRPTYQTIPEYYLHTIDSIFINSINEYNVDDYHNFLGLYSGIMAFEIYDTLLNALKKRDRVLSTKIQMDDYQKRFSGIQKDYLVSLSLNYLIKDGYVDPQIFNKYSATVSNTYYKEFLLKNYTESQKVWAEGFDLSKQHVTDLSLSDTISLFTTLRKDHKGKVVYIDIWATWCGPCISNFSFMPKIKETFKYLDIDFVYLAISSDKDAWLKIIKANKVTGFHYFLSEKQTKELKGIIDYQVIPRYAIMDRNGKVINPDAKMPSDPDIVNHLKEYIIKQ